MIVIISGPSSAGKSTFIESGKAANMIGFPDQTKTVFALELKHLHDWDNGDTFLHYNILRPLENLQGRIAGKIILCRLIEKLRWIRVIDYVYWRRLQKHWDYSLDPAWRKIIASRAAKKAIVLVTGKEELIRRASQRTATEANDKCKDIRFVSSYWVHKYRVLSLPAIYHKWCAELERHDIEYQLIHSVNDKCEKVDRVDAVRELLDGKF